MNSLIYPQNNPFHLVTGELMPEYRDAYLQSRLTPTVALQVEQYLDKSSIQTSLALARYRELLETARLKDRTVTAPLWVQKQLLFQPLVSGTGPLRRPVVRVALLMFLALSVASGVQWMRNEPLLPAPVVAAVTRASASISEATSSLVKKFTAPQVAKTAPVPAATRPARARPKAAAPELSRLAMATAAIPASPAALVSVVTPIDSVGRTLPATLQPTTLQPAGEASSAAARPASAVGTVQGYIRDDQGRPLAGATVLVKGAQQGTSTDATGQYVLEVTAGSTLQFGYAGYTDQLRSATLGLMNVVLQPSTKSAPTTSAQTAAPGFRSHCAAGQYWPGACR